MNLKSNNFNQNDTNQNPFNILRGLGQLKKTKGSLKFLIYFVLGIAPLIIEASIISPSYTDSMSRAFEMNATWLWLTGFFTFIIVTMLGSLIVYFSDDIHIDVIAPLMTYSFTSMFILATRTLDPWIIMLIVLGVLFVMTGVFQLLVYATIGLYIFYKFRKSMKSIKNNQSDFQHVDSTMNNIFTRNPEMMRQMKKYLEQMGVNPSDLDKLDEKFGNKDEDKEEDKDDDDIIDI